MEYCGPKTHFADAVRWLGAPRRYCVGHLLQTDGHPSGSFPVETMSKSFSYYVWNNPSTESDHVPIWVQEGSGYTHISEQTQNGLRIDLGGYEKLIRCAFGGCRSLCSRNTKTGRGMMKCSERGWPENSVDFLIAVKRHGCAKECKGSFVPGQHGETCFRCTWATIRNRAVAYTSSLSIWVLV